MCRSYGALKDLGVNYKLPICHAYGIFQETNAIRHDISVKKHLIYDFFELRRSDTF